MSAVRTSLEICAVTVIPSLFPYLVLSDLIVSSGLSEKLGVLGARPIKKIFAISEKSSAAIILGALCGFPVGAKTAAALYEKGSLSKSDTERLLCFCNNTGPGFLVSGIGVSFFGSARLGLLFYAVQLLSSLLIGVTCRFFKKSSNAYESDKNSVSKKSGIKLFTDAVSESAKATLPICGYIVFFSYLISIVGTLVSTLTESAAIRAFIFGIFELSSGTLASAELFSAGYPFVFCAALCAFFIGWSGISVHAQTAAICRKQSLSLTPYIFAKLTQGLLCAVFVCGYFLIFPENALPAFAPSEKTVSIFSVFFSFAVNFIFIFAIIKIFIKNRRKKTFFVIL